MDNAIPSLIIGAILLVASALTAHGSIQTYDRLGQSLKSMESRLGEQAQSRLAITDATLDPEGDTLTLLLRNDGQVRVALYDRVDVIVSYTSAGGYVSAWLPFMETTAANSWRLVSIVDDSFEPGLLNPGEAAQVAVELGTPVLPGQTNRIVIVSESGAVVSVPFTS